MDPITTAIVAGLAAGATAGATQVGKKALVDAYSSLKALVLKKFGKENTLTKAVAELEAKPDSKGRQLTLEEEVEAAGAGKDPELVQAAKLLVTALENYAQQQKENIGFDLKHIKIARMQLEADVEDGTGVRIDHGESDELNAKVTVKTSVPNA